MDSLVAQCSDNNLALNVEKTKELVIDFRRVPPEHRPLTINRAVVERVESTKFLGVHITENLSWETNTAALAKKAQQRLYFLRRLKRAGASTTTMLSFYRGTIESVLTNCVTVWHGSCTASRRRSLQRTVRAAERIIGATLPPLQDLYDSRLVQGATRVMRDPTHPAHGISPLPSGRRLRSLPARTTRLINSTFHQAVRALNSLPALPLLPALTARMD